LLVSLREKVYLVRYSRITMNVFHCTTKGTAEKNQLIGAEGEYRRKGNTTGFTGLEKLDWKMAHRQKNVQ
jgi:hypothetical protein